MEGSVGAELNAELVGGSFRSETAVEELDDLCRKLHASDGANGGRGVVGKVELVLIRKSTDLVESVVGEKASRWNACVVNASNVEVIEDCIAVSHARLCKMKELTSVSILIGVCRCVEGGVDHGKDVLVEACGGVQESGVLWRVKVLVGAGHGVEASGSSLEPAIALTAAVGGGNSDRNQLVSIHWRRDDGAVGKSLLISRSSDRRVQALEEAGGRVLEDIVGG